MAIGDSYATLAELKSRLGITGSTDDTVLTGFLATASRGVEKYCRRQFNDAGATSSRLYYRNGLSTAVVDDFSTSAGFVLETDLDDDGTFEITWAATDYQLEPLNGIVEGVPGYPYWLVRSLNRTNLFMETFSGRASIRVTARWGWTAVPPAVHDATLIGAEELYKLKDAPFGVAGFGDFGQIRVRDNPKVQALLSPYRRDAVLVV
jgi:Phage gp6-like head-tail connector protein